MFFCLLFLFFLQTTDIPAARAHLQGVVQKLLSWAENVPPLLSLTEYEKLLRHIYTAYVCF
jgi:hypothetical protein